MYAMTDFPKGMVARLGTGPCSNGVNVEKVKPVEAREVDGVYFVLTTTKVDREWSYIVWLMIHDYERGWVCLGDLDADFNGALIYGSFGVSKEFLNQWSDDQLWAMLRCWLSKFGGGPETADTQYFGANGRLMPAPRRLAGFKPPKPPKPFPLSLFSM